MYRNSESYYSVDVPPYRDPSSSHRQRKTDQNNFDENAKSAQNNQNFKYIRECLVEKSLMDKQFPIAAKLIDGEIEVVHTNGRVPAKEQYADIYRQKPIKILQKVYIPTREHPKFNFVGKILGPGGNSLRRLQEETLCKIVILGRNSMRDRVKEEELRLSADPKYAHLNNHLHVEVSTVATPSEAYARMAYAMAELRKYLVPEKKDEIRQEQLRELMDGPDGDKHRAKIQTAREKYDTPSGSRTYSNSRNTHSHEKSHQKSDEYHSGRNKTDYDETSRYDSRKSYDSSDYVEDYQQQNNRSSGTRRQNTNTNYPTTSGGSRPRDGVRYKTIPYMYNARR